jgi:hypothetical protein
MSPSRSKSVAVAFLLGAFVTGGASGFAAGRNTDAPRKQEDRYTREYTYNSMVRELARELQLSDEQTAAVDSILKWRRGVYDTILVPVRPALDSARDSARTLIEQRLDPAQRDAFIQLRNRMAARADSARGDTATLSKNR